MKYIKDRLLGILPKGEWIQHLTIIHRLLAEFLSLASDADKKELASHTLELIPYILHTREGSQASVHAISYSSAKDRKTIVKGLKGYMLRSAQEEYGHIVLLRLLDVVDDTVLLQSSVLAPLVASDEIGNTIQNKYARLVLLQVLAPKFKLYFTPSTLALLQPCFLADAEGKLQPTSKKNDDQRTQELQVQTANALSRTFGQF